MRMTGETETIIETGWMPLLFLANRFCYTPKHALGKLRCPKPQIPIIPKVLDHGVIDE